MLIFLRKFIFRILRPNIVFITGNGRALAAESILKVLQPHYKIKKLTNGKLPYFWSKKEILLVEKDLAKNNNLKELKFLIQKSRLPVFVVTNLGEIPSDKDYFEGEEEDTVLLKEIIKVLPLRGFLLLNYDDGLVRRLKNETLANVFSFGFAEGANFRATDVNVDSNGINFKINYAGNIVPFWLDNSFGKEQVYGALAAASASVIKTLNLVEISQSLR
jgi:UDP-N-acetylmuramyl pentapeptide synthase